MKKEIPIILTVAMLMNSCRPVVAKAVGPEIPARDPEKTFYDPTLVPPSPTHDSTYDDLFAIKPTKTPSPEPTPARVEIVNPIADSCILPFPGATLDGLWFKSTIYNNGSPEVEADGTVHRHLGLDFKSGFKGIDISNMCDGTLVFSGAVRKGTGLNLGNVVVMKYVYTENGQTNVGYMRYAHMENVIELPPGTVIPKGQKIGEMGHSGGWEEVNTHLHIDFWKEEAWNRIVVERSGDNLANEAGYYALAEIWGDNDFEKNLIDPKEWLLARLK